MLSKMARNVDDVEDVPSVPRTVDSNLLHELFKREQELVSGLHKGDEEFRPFFARCGGLESRNGSAYVEMGLTKVICAIDGPKETSKRVHEDCKTGIVNVTVINATGLDRFIKSGLEELIALDKLPKMEVDVEVTILGNAGSVLAAALMCSSLALSNARIPTLDLCVAAEVSITPEGRLMLDVPRKRYNSTVTVAVMPTTLQNVCFAYDRLAGIAKMNAAAALAAKSALTLLPMLKNAIKHN